SSGGTFVAAAGLGGDIAVWNVRGRSRERTIHYHDLIQSIRFSPHGREIVIRDLHGNVTFWDPLTGRHVGPTLPGQNGDVLSVTFNPAGTELVTTSTDGNLRLWDLASGKLIGAPFSGAGGSSGGATFFPDGKHVIAAYRSGTGVVWSVDPAVWKALA